MPALFRNVLFMFVLMLGMGLGFASSVYAETEPAKIEAHTPQHEQAVAPPAVRTEITSAPVRVELLEKLQDRLIELEKETAVLKAELGARIDGQDNYISNGLAQHGAQVTMLSNQTTQLGNYISYTSLALVVIGLLAGVFAFRRAEQIAKDQSVQWFEKNERGLHERIQHLLEQVNEVVKHAAEAKCSIEQSKQNVIDDEAGYRQRREQAEASLAKGEKPSEEVTQQVKQDARDLDAKPRSAWTAEDFHNAGVYSFTSGDYEAALTRWDAVINMLADSPEPALRERVAKALVNKGVTLSQLNQSQEAIGVYDDLIRRFGESPEPALREQVAKALVNKGVRLGRLNQSQEEIGVYDDLIRRFGESPEPALREQVVKALVNKGVRLGRLNQSQEAIAIYDEVIRRFGESPEPEIRKIVEKARRKLDGKP